MTRTLLAVLLAATPLLTAAPAGACTGVPCNQICDAWNSKLGQKVVDGPCPLG